MCCFVPKARRDGLWTVKNSEASPSRTAEGLIAGGVDVPIDRSQTLEDISISLPGQDADEMSVHKEMQKLVPMLNPRQAKINFCVCWFSSYMCDVMDFSCAMVGSMPARALAMLKSYHTANRKHQRKETVEVCGSICCVASIYIYVNFLL